MAGWAMSCILPGFAQEKQQADVLPVAQATALAVHTTASKSAMGSIRGIVLEAGTSDPLVGVHVQLRGTTRGAVTDLDGQFAMQRIPAGVYVLEARMLGFSTLETQIEVQAKKTGLQTDGTITLNLHEALVELSGIEVTPEETVPELATVLGVQQIPAYRVARAKTFDEDIYRTVARTPGIVANDFSSRFLIRGGDDDEVLVTLDGLELNDPFHLQDFGGGGLSIVDADIVESMTLSTGGYTADQGDKMSGVFQMTSVDPTASQAKTRVGLSLMNARFFSQGAFANGKTKWVLSARRGYLDFLLDLMQTYPSYSPHFYDTFAKVSHSFDSRHTVSLQGLLSGDEMEYLDITDPNDQVQTHYGNGYVWLNWQAVWGPRLLSETVVSRGRVWRERRGVDVRRDKLINFETDDTRRFALFQIKQDWTLQHDAETRTRWGMSLKRQRASYVYSSGRLVQHVAAPQASQKVTNQYATRNAATNPAGVLFNLYGSHQVSLTRSAMATAGLRTGYVSWSGDFYVDPRLNLQYSLGAVTVLRGAWGYFHQPQGIEQLYVEDEEQRYHDAERARHLIVGMDHGFGDKLLFKLDLYDKHYRNVRPQYVSPAGDVAALFPEIDNYRMFWNPDEARTRGVEVSLIKAKGQFLTGSIGYSLSQAYDVLEEQRYYKDHDQRHGALIDLNIQPAQKLMINLSWQYHTGWRHADAAFDVTYRQGGDVLFDTHFGPRNAERYPAYHKMDLRVARRFALRGQTVAAYVEIQNLYNRSNTRLFRYEPQIDGAGNVAFITHAESWLPRLPSFGLKWEITH